MKLQTPWIHLKVTQNDRHTKKSWETLEQNCTQLSCIEWYRHITKNHEKHFSKIKQKTLQTPCNVGHINIVTNARIESLKNQQNTHEMLKTHDANALVQRT
jgi:hypothetical protein